MKIYYEERYGGIYEVPDNIAADEQKLSDDLMEQFNIHNECQGSVTVELISKDNFDYQIMGGEVDALSDNEKEFYLWHLLRFWYTKKLNADKEKYANDRTTIEQINRLLANVEELDTLLGYDIF